MSSVSGAGYFTLVSLAAGLLGVSTTLIQFELTAVTLFALFTVFAVSRVFFTYLSYSCSADNTLSEPQKVLRAKLCRAGK